MRHTISDRHIETDALRKTEHGPVTKAPKQLPNGFNFEKPIFEKKHPLEFAKVMSNRNPRASFKTVNNEVLVFLKYYLTFKQISWLKSLSSSLAHCFIVVNFNIS